MRLETERLILRPFREEDRTANAAIFADPEVRRFALAVLDRAGADARMDLAIAEWTARGFGMLAVENKPGGTLIGMLGLTGFGELLRATIPSHPDIEIAWQLARPFWGQGLAPEGARAVPDFAWDGRGLPEVVAITAAINLPSQRVMEKIGMTRSAEDDFDHPNVPIGNALRPHLLYRITNPRQ